MKPAVYLIAFLALVCGTPVAWAGAAEEVAEINKQLAAAGAQNNVDGVTAAFADNAVITLYLTPFRVEGKPAIKDFFTTFYENFPTRHASLRQASTRVYANDGVVVTNAYVVDTFTDKKGNDSVHYISTSRTWVKIGAEWKIVDWHNSRVPIP